MSEEAVPQLTSPDRPFNGHTKVLLSAAMVLVPVSLLLSTVAAVGGYLTSEDVKAQNRRLEAEVEARREATCTQALDTRTEQRDMWVRILQQAGVSEPTIDILRDGYDDLPAPVSCE